MDSNLFRFQDQPMTTSFKDLNTFNFSIFFPTLNKEKEWNLKKNQTFREKIKKMKMKTKFSCVFFLENQSTKRYAKFK